MQEAGSGPVRRGGYAVVKFFDLEGRTSAPLTSARVWAKNQPSSYFIEARRWPPALGIER